MRYFSCLRYLPGLAVSFLCSTSVFAEDLSNGFAGTFAKSAQACKQASTSENIEDDLTVDAQGVSGYEFGCQFIQLHRIASEGGPDSYIALAECSDDSGIFRPDNFSLVFNDEGRQLVLQSQNEYVEGGESYVSGEYVRCD